MSKEVAKTNGSGGNQDRVESTRGARIYRPLADICETGNGVVLAIDMPGVGPDDVNITIEKRVLTIRANGQQTRPEGYRPIYAEYGEGDYERAFSLSEEIDEAKIKAAVHGGVLMLELPKVEPAKPKRIQVKAA
jgi:HSP20 family molecular chaperone IbpA